MFVPLNIYYYNHIFLYVNAFFEKFSVFYVSKKFHSLYI
nr:MAG TPA: hypothetical protein [Caudoviricetes sp.]